MKIRKSKLSRIILEEIEKYQLEEQFRSEEEIRAINRAKLTDDDPDNDDEVDPDYRAAFLSVYNPAKYVTDAIAGDIEEETGDDKPEGDADFVDDIMASYYLFWVKGMMGGVLSAPLGKDTASMIAAGYAIIMSGEGMSDTAQLFYPEYWGEDKELPNATDLDGNPLSGCQATARILVAGVAYNKIYEAYNLVLGKADRILSARLRRIIGARRFMAIAPMLDANDVKQILSLALVLKLLRDHQPTKDAITSLTSELCSIKNPATAYQAIETIMIKFIFGTPGFIMGVYKDLIDELTDLTNASKETEKKEDTTGPDPGELT